MVKKIRASFLKQITLYNIDKIIGRVSWLLYEFPEFLITTRLLNLDITNLVGIKSLAGWVFHLSQNDIHLF